jgi:hypothetical protein
VTYSVVKRERKDDFWLNIGMAFAYDDGDGFNLLLQALGRRQSRSPHLPGEAGRAKKVIKTKFIKK